MKKIHQCSECKHKVLDDIICDMCGKSCHEDKDYGYEYASLEARWGYMSPWDTEQHEAHFCIECYKKIMQLIQNNGGTISINNYDLWPY